MYTAEMFREKVERYRTPEWLDQWLAEEFYKEFETSHAAIVEKSFIQSKGTLPIAFMLAMQDRGFIVNADTDSVLVRI